MNAHPGTEKGYALDFLSPVQYVAVSLERAPALSSELVKGYKHRIAGDLTRVRQHEGLSSNAEASAFLVERALIALGKQVEQNGDGKWRLTRTFDEIRYNRKKLHRMVDYHAILGDPFNPMSGIWAENIRDGKIRDDKADVELRLQMAATMRWDPDMPAIKDERGVVIVGHRRLQIAEELGIEPVIVTRHFGSGDSADIDRLLKALDSNLGAKPMTPTDRKKIAEHLGLSGWSQTEIANVLRVSQQTISNDLAATNAGNKKTAAARPSTIDDPEWQLVHDPIIRSWRAGEITRDEALDLGRASSYPKPCSTTSYTTRSAALGLPVVRHPRKKVELTPEQNLEPTETMTTNGASEPDWTDAVRLESTECTCPNCGHHFVLEGAA